MEARRRIAATSVALLVAALGLGAVAQQASATTLRAHRLMTAAGQLVSDGQRYAAVLTSPTTVTILDTQAESARQVTVTVGCTPIGVGGALVLLSCPGGPNLTPMLLSAATGASVPIAGWPEVLQQAQDRGLFVGPITVGSQWISLRASTPQVTLSWYLNWRTGQLRDAPTSVRQVADLNSAALTQTLCRPLRRNRRSVQDQAGAFWPFFYQRPYGVATNAQGTYVQRCGQRPRHRLMCPAGCPSLQLGASVVTWATATGAVLRDLRAGRTYTIRVPGGVVSAVAHTRCDVFVSAATNNTPQPPTVVVYRAKRPHCCPT